MNEYLIALIAFAVMAVLMWVGTLLSTVRK